MAFITKRNAERDAKSLIERNVSMETYLEVQEQRLYRLSFWERNGVSFMVDRERELVEYGEKVISILEKHYNQ